MTTFADQIDAILTDPLARLRGAARPIGYMGSDIAEDLLAAPGITACHLPWTVGVPTPHADDWLEPAFPPFVRAILQQWAEGTFDLLEAVVFTRGDDAIQRLYYYICELQRDGRIGGPKPLIFDIAKAPSKASADRTMLAIERLAAELALDQAAIREGIATANARRRWFAALQVKGALRDRIARAGLFAGLEALIPPVRDAASSPGVLLAGTAPPDDRLNVMVEASGWTVVGEVHERALSRLGPEVPESRDPIAAIAAQISHNPVGPRAFIDPGPHIVAAARACDARAVIVWLTETEEALVWHAPAQQRELAAAGIPACFLTRRRWDGADGVDTEINAFLKGIAA